MRLGKSRRLRHLSTAIVLVLVLLGFLPQLAHADTFVGYTQANTPGAANCFDGTFVTCDGNGQTNGVIGQAVQAPFNGKITAASFFTGSSAPNRIVVLTFPAGTSPGGLGTQSCSPTAGSFKFDNGGTNVYTLGDIESIATATFTYTTVALAAPVTVVQNQWIFIGVEIASGSSTTMLKNAIGAGPCSQLFTETTFTIPPSSTIGSTFTATSNFVSGPDIMGGTFTATGQVGTTVTVTQCYGNCGTPAITLANTNSTHTVNWNQSIMLFYPFQSNINGFILNVTTSVAKTNTNNIVNEIIYTVPTCPQGQSPFTQQCPGYLASQWNPQAANKGKVTNGNYQIPIANGQWAAVAIFGQFSGLDLNDTNTALSVSQTTSGGSGCNCPPPGSISQSAVFSSSFKMGLWAWVVGNVVTSQPPTTPGVSLCPGLDCILTEATNSFCTNVTTACQTGSALFWVIILTIISVVTLVMGLSAVLPEANIGRMGIGELAILFFIGWIVIFTSFSLLSVYVLLLTFFIVAALSARTVRGYVGI